MDVSGDRDDIMGRAETGSIKEWPHEPRSNQIGREPQGRRPRISTLPNIAACGSAQGPAAILSEDGKQQAYTHFGARQQELRRL